MLLRWTFVLVFVVSTKCEEPLKLMAKSLSSRLYKYTGYADAVILHYKVLQDSSFVSFKFQAEEVPLSIFGCKPKSITFYIKQGSPPVINPDGSKFPSGFIHIRRPIPRSATFKSDNEFNYINITSPFAGSYFGVAFISYSDPNDEAITQEGLGPNCLTLLNTALYGRRASAISVVVSDKDMEILLYPNNHQLFKFHVPEIADFAILNLNEIKFCPYCNALLIKVRVNRIPEVNRTLYDIQLKKENYDKKTFFLRFMTIENCWYYIDFVFTANDDNVTIYQESASIITFNITFFSNDLNVSYADVHNETIIKTNSLRGNEISMTVPNSSVLFKHSILRNYDSKFLNYSISTNQYNLVREGHIETFMYFFDLYPNPDGMTPLYLNMSNNNVVILKFYLNEGIDVGGTLQFSLAFKPIVRTVGAMKVIDNEPENHVILACIHNNAKEIPEWPNKCCNSKGISVAPIILNKTRHNSTIYLPYPEPGNWYASLKLFCEEPKPCACLDNCKKDYTDCVEKCEDQCPFDNKTCQCVEICEKIILNRTDCENCDCEGPYQKSKTACNSSVMFALASYPCVSGKCGPNGKCMYMVSQGLSYSVCICSRKYKGWDCTDDSNATTYGMIILELLLLVLSNLLFLPAVYIAFRREYYVEAIVYFSTCFFSTFYHACDAGENIYSYCLVRLGVLQFSDFFCGLLSIWVTVIAMAHLPNPWPSICHISGAILLAFGTTVNKGSLWVFAVPFCTGILILIISWVLHYRKTHSRFPSKRYQYVIFPSGLLVVVIGLTVYAALQTQSNYKYLHSMWHMMMATAIMILIPNRSTFLPTPVDTID